MFRKLLILLGLLVAPAFGQELPPTIQDPTATQTYTLTVVPGTQLDNIQQTGTPANLGDDSTLTNVAIGFDFYYYGNLYNTVNISQNGFISFTSLANGCCSGQPLPNLTELNQFNQGYFNYINTHNTIFAMWSDLISFTGNPYYQSFEDKFTVGWYGVEELGSYRQNCALDLFGLPLFCNPVGPNTFDFEITLHANNDIAIRYGNFNNPVNTGRSITSGIQGDQPGEFWQIYFGSDTSTLEGKTYVFNSSEIVPIAPEPPIAPDCTLNPTDPTCIINDVTTPEEETYFADEETGSDDGSDDGTEVTEEEELLAEESSVEEELFDENLDETPAEEALEEILADLDEEDSDVEEAERIVVYRELNDEEKAQILADAISKNTLESALSIAADATTSTTSTAAASNTETSSSTSTSRSTTESSTSSTSTTETTLVAEMAVEQKEETSAAAGDASSDILETGRQLGQQALSETMAATEASASDSMSQAESVAQTSSFESMGSPSSTVETINSIEIENVIETVAAAESNTDTSMEMMGMSEPTTETGNVSDGSEIFVSVENNPSAASAQEAEDVALAVVNNSITSSEQKTFEDETNTDAEVTSAMIDPALAVANTFNQAPSMMSLDFLGVLKPIEEKSDAELRAEQVVAANKEEQDAINANYMDADQSGIVAAIGADADVSSYLSARLADNNTWYKPEDIYKGVVIKDNARGSYFLEKGNTDTYKKMVDEQYK
jgi:hypothetical protein